MRSRAVGDVSSRILRFCTLMLKDAEPAAREHACVCAGEHTYVCGEHACVCATQTHSLWKFTLKKRWSRCLYHLATRTIALSKRRALLRSSLLKNARARVGLQEILKAMYGFVELSAVSSYLIAVVAIMKRCHDRHLRLSSTAVVSVKRWHVW